MAKASVKNIYVRAEGACLEVLLVLLVGVGLQGVLLQWDAHCFVEVVDKLSIVRGTFHVGEALNGGWEVLRHLICGVGGPS